jgi:hypothetical protein
VLKNELNASKKREKAVSREWELVRDDETA